MNTSLYVRSYRVRLPDLEIINTLYPLLVLARYTGTSVRSELHGVWNLPGSSIRP